MARGTPLEPEEALAIRQVSDPQCNPKGTQVAFVVTDLDPERKDYRRHLWTVSITGGDARPLTFQGQRNAEPRWSPDGEILAFVSDRHADDETSEAAKNQIWLLPAAGGEARQLTRAPGGVQGIDWAPDGSALLFLSTETAGPEEKALQERGGIRVVEGFPKMVQVWVVEVDSGRCRRLTGDRSSKAAARWSPDGRWIAFEKRPTATSNDVYRSAVWVMDRGGRRKRKLSREPGCDTCPQWSPDGTRVAFLHRPSARYPGFERLAVRPVRGGPMRVLTEALDRGVQDPQWAADGLRIFCRVQDGPRLHVHTVTTRGASIRRLTEGDRAISAMTLSAGSRRLVLVSSSPMQPGELSLICVGRAGGAGETPLTDMNPQLRATALGRTRVVAWKAADGTPIEGLLVLPSGYRRGRALPTVVAPHGGPAGCVNLGFNARWQVLAGRGYAVLAPNFRGSSGYGQAFLEANADDFGGGDFGDVMAGVDMLVARGIADGQRLAMTGASYGGFMTAWTIGHTTRFKAAVVGAGVTNLHSFFGTTDIQWFTRGYQGGAPWERFESYVRQSPITYVDRMQTPTLIYHGDEDRRVPVEQGEQLYVALRERRVPVVFVRYPRAGHALAEYHHQLDCLKRSLDWFDRHLSPRR